MYDPVCEESHSCACISHILLKEICWRLLCTISDYVQWSSQEGWSLRSNPSPRSLQVSIQFASKVGKLPRWQLACKLSP